MAKSVKALKGAGAVAKKGGEAILDIVRSSDFYKGLIEPKKTTKAYKLFRTDPDQPGKLFPLFVDAKKEVPVGEWVKAELGQKAKSGKVKSSIGDLAFRPGWHSGKVPSANHIGSKVDLKTGKKAKGMKKPNVRPENQVWAEVEVPADVDWHSEAQKRASKRKDGKIIERTAHITDQLPSGGHYRYKTNSNMDGEWLISGEMKVNRVLTDKEVAKINDAHGTHDLPRLKSDKGVDHDTLEGFHFSRHREPVRRLDGSKYGTGAKGVERTRVNLGDPELRDRTFFYTEGSRPQEGFLTPKPESVVGQGPTYQVKVNNMYNVAENPLGLTEQNLERVLKDNGFNGYYNPENGLAVALQGETEALRIGSNRAEAEKALRRSERLVDQPFNVTAENMPSTDTEFGKWLSEQPPEVRERYSDQVEDMLEREQLMAKLGIEDYALRPGYGSYEGGVNPNAVISVNTADEAKRLADARGAVTQQDAVPFFQRGAGDEAGLQVTLDRGVAPNILEEVNKATGLDMTRSDLDVLDFINFQDEAGKPLSGMSDVEFDNVLRQFFDRTEGVEDLTRFQALGNYNETKQLWRPDGELVRGKLAEAGQQVEVLDEIRKRVEDYNQRFHKQHGFADPRALAFLGGVTSVGALALGSNNSEAGLLRAVGDGSGYAGRAVETVWDELQKKDATEYVESLAKAKLQDEALKKMQNEFLFEANLGKEKVFLDEGLKPVEPAAPDPAEAALSRFAEKRQRRRGHYSVNEGREPELAPRPTPEAIESPLSHNITVDQPQVNSLLDLPPEAYESNQSMAPIKPQYDDRIVSTESGLPFPAVTEPIAEALHGFNGAMVEIPDYLMIRPANALLSLATDARIPELGSLDMVRQGTRRGFMDPTLGFNLGFEPGVDRRQAAAPWVYGAGDAAFPF